MAYSKAQNEATKKYQKNNYFRVMVTFKKEDQEQIEKKASEQNKTPANYIKDIIISDINTTNKKEVKKSDPEIIQDTEQTEQTPISNKDIFKERYLNKETVKAVYEGSDKTKKQRQEIENNYGTTLKLI